MGRWAQYRKRGRAGPPAFAYPPPVAEDWEVNPDIGFSFVQILTGDAPSSHYQARWRPSPAGEWSLWSSPPSTVGDGTGLATDAGLVDVQIRWSNADASSVSDSSDTKTILAT